MLFDTVENGEASARKIISQKFGKGDVKTNLRSKKLTDSEQEFCEYFAWSGDAYRAAESAGYENPKKDGAHLLCRTDICRKIDSICETMLKSSRMRACLGYEKLALGSAADAVRLMYCDDMSAEELAGLDLFNVAEIKRPKDGAMEIKFFDRLKALEKLNELESDTSVKKETLFDAIQNSVKALEKADDNGRD